LKSQCAENRGLKVVKSIKAKPWKASMVERDSVDGLGNNGARKRIADGRQSEQCEEVDRE
jgi:hypothetical protein